MSSKINPRTTGSGATKGQVLEQDEALPASPRSSPKPPEQHSFAISAADIDFFNIAPDLVTIEVKVTNDSDSTSAPDILELRAAPFGAFVPWRPLATIPLPALAPRQVRYFRWRAGVLQLAPLGPPDGVGPGNLLTASGLADEPPKQPASKEPKQPGQPAARAAPSQPAGTLPPGLLDLLLQDTPHWAGNINVLVGNVDVERHRAQALRVYPGRLNMAWFIVGGSAPDAYAFRLQGPGSHWDARLFDMTSREALVISAEDDGAVVPGEWLETSGSRTLLLALRVPRPCDSATVEVHVTQKSTQRTAVVEFSLDPAAAGRGCYTV